MIPVCLSDEEFERARVAVLGPSGIELLRLVCDVSLGRAQDPLDRTLSALAVELNWLESTSASGSSPPRLTSIGSFVADPIREYLFFLERDRTLHNELFMPAYRRENFAGERVLEIGSGWGVNLLPLQSVAQEVIGLDPMPLYRQFTRILCELEGCEPPRVISGIASELPFAPGEFDTVLMFSVHQYTRIPETFAEVARVLRPGGRFYLCGGRPGPLFSDLWTGLVRRRPHKVKQNLTILANTGWYELFERRLVGEGVLGTSYPVYPTQRFLARHFEKNGFVVQERLPTRFRDIAWLAHKPR